MTRAPSSIPAKTFRKWTFIYLLLFYLGLCCLLFFLYVRPSLLREDSLHMGADSETYMAAANSIDLDNGAWSSILTLVSFQGQLLGPVLIAKLLKTNVHILELNSFIFILGLWFASKLPGIKIGTFSILLILNLTTTASILTLNKEIITYISIIMFVGYIYSPRRSRLMLAIILLCSLLARWEQCLIIILFLVVEHKWSPLKGKHKTTLAMMIAGITVVWPLLIKSGVVGMAGLLGTAANAQSQSLPFLNSIQAEYGFPIVLIPKVIGSVFGFTWITLLNTITAHPITDVQNQLVSPFQNLAMQIIFVVAFVKGKLKMNKPIVFWMSLYIIMTAAAPIFQPRYQYPVYVLLCLELSGLCDAGKMPTVALQSDTSQSLLAKLLRRTYLPA